MYSEGMLNKKGEKMSKHERLVKRLDNIDAEYQGKIDKVKAEWEKQSAIVWHQIMEERKEMAND